MARRGPSLLRLLRRHPLAGTAVGTGGAAGLGVDAWIGVSTTTQLVITVAAAGAVPAIRAMLDIRYGAVYRIWVWHPDDVFLSERARRVVCGYIGKTRQRPGQRVEQHFESQPWADTIARWEVIHESRLMTGIGLHLRERWRIIIHRPLYNYIMNLGNRRRIPKYMAKQQRDDRDALRLI